MDVPTIVSFSLLQLIMEQNVGIPVPHSKGRLAGPQGLLPEQSSPSTVEQIIDIPAPGRGVERGLQGFSQERSSTACTMQQNVDIPVPGSGLHDLPVPGSSSSSAVSRDVRGKSATLPPRSGSALPPHSSPWTPAAYDVTMAVEAEEEESEEELDDHVEYVEFDGRWWGCEWVPARQQHCWWLAAVDGSQIGHTIWRLPWLIGRVAKIITVLTRYRPIVLELI